MTNSPGILIRRRLIHMMSLMSGARRVAWELVLLLHKVCLRECRYFVFFALTNGSCEAAYGLGDVVHTGAGKAIRKVKGESNNLEALESDAGDKSLGEERTMESRDHEKVHGFPSSIVPTMEEKVVMESLDSIPEDKASSEEERGDHDKTPTPTPPNGDARESHERGGSAESKNRDVKTNGDAQTLEPKRDHSEVRTSRSAKSVRDPSTSSTNLEARVENGELYGAPADASRDPKTDDQPPHAVSGKNDATETEEKAVHARAEIRNHLSNAKFGSKIWTLPTPTPTVDPDGFEDPISDEFWKKVWMACAVHNVGGSSSNLLPATADMLPPCRPRSIARCSTPSPTILSLLGSSTRISYSTTNG
jgi:phospholipase D1/2